MKKCVWLLACLSAAAANTPTAVILPDNLGYRLFKLLPKADVQNVLDMLAVTLRSLHPPLLGRLERWVFSGVLFPWFQRRSRRYDRGRARDAGGRGLHPHPAPGRGGGVSPLRGQKSALHPTVLREIVVLLAFVLSFPPLRSVLQAHCLHLHLRLLHLGLQGWLS